MATTEPKYSLELLSAQEHIPMCEKHCLIIDITCKDCDKLICSQCAKTDHKDHDWNTIPTAGILKRRELNETLSKVKKKDMKAIDEKIKRASKQMEDNQKCCEFEISKLQKHFDAIVSKLDDIKKNFEKKLKETLDRKNAKVSENKIDLEKKRNQIDDLVKFLEGKHSTMSDYNLIDNLRDLTNLVSYKDSDLEKINYSARYRKGGISKGLLDAMMGQTIDLDDITVSETDSFNFGFGSIFALEAISEDTCFLFDIKLDNFARIDIRNKKAKKNQYRCK